MNTEKKAETRWDKSRQNSIRAGQGRVLKNFFSPLPREQAQYIDHWTCTQFTGEIHHTGTAEPALCKHFYAFSLASQIYEVQLFASESSWNNPGQGLRNRTSASERLSTSHIEVMGHGGISTSRTAANRILPLHHPVHICRYFFQQGQNRQAKKQILAKNW